MKSSMKYSTGLDIQHEYLTLAQYDPGEHAVTMVAIQPITVSAAASPIEAAGDDLDSLRSRYKLVSGLINCALPGDYTILKKLPVDPQEDDVDGALAWELGQHLVGDVDEYFVDYEPVGKSPDGLQEYLVVASRREQVDQFTGFLKRHKLVPGVVDIDLFALINVFEANYPELTDRPALILHAENESARLIMTQKGSYVDHETINYDTEIDPRTFTEHLQAGTERLLSFTRSRDDGTAIPIFSSGGLFVQPGFLDAVASAVTTVSQLNPFRKIGCRVGVEEDKLAGYIPQLSVAVGLSLRGDV